MRSLVFVLPRVVLSKMKQEEIRSQPLGCNGVSVGVNGKFRTHLRFMECFLSQLVFHFIEL